MDGGGEREKEREERDRKTWDIWIQEEEQRRLSEGGQTNLLSPDYNKKVIMLTMFIAGDWATFAPVLLPFLFPAAPAVEAGFAAGDFVQIVSCRRMGFCFGWPLESLKL